MAVGDIDSPEQALDEIMEVVRHGHGNDETREEIMPVLELLWSAARREGYEDGYDSTTAYYTEN